MTTNTGTSFECNLPGWRWATITKVALDRLSRSLHSGVCDSDGLRDAAIHSTISGRGCRRDRAAPNRYQSVALFIPVYDTVKPAPTRAALSMCACKVRAAQKSIIT